MKIVDDLITPFEIWGEDNQWVLKEKTAKGYAIRGYFQHIDSIFKPLIRHLIVRNNGTVTMKRFIEEYKTKQDQLEGIFKKVFKSRK